MAQHCGDLSIKSLAEHIGISQKHLGHQFKKIVGVTPKNLARIYRFQTVLQSIQPKQGIDWAAIAHHCQYHDQSHFNKDFAHFTGLTPTQYVTLLAPYIDDSEDYRHFVPIG